MPAAANFKNLRVAAFESRRADDMARLIERHGGRAFVSPSMREAHIGENPDAAKFAEQVIAGKIDVVIVMTGVGFRHLFDEIATQTKAGRTAATCDGFLQALEKITTIARGPKPVAAMRERGFKPTHRVPEPNTWREILELIDREVPVAGKTVGVQEYGIPNRQLTAGLEERGAKVETVQVYRWEFPEVTAPLEENVRALSAGERDVVLFTSANQLSNVLAMAKRLNLEEETRRGLSNAVIASIGPTTSEALAAAGLRADLEPDHPRMGNLVAAAARQANELLAAKRS